MKKQISNTQIWKSADYRNPAWIYVPSDKTNIRETMDRYREFLKATKK